MGRAKGRSKERQRVPVEVSLQTAPDGTTMVLLQLPDGYVLVSRSDALTIAELLVDVAMEELGR